MEGLKLLSKIALKKWNTNFRLEHSERKNRITYSEILRLPEISNWMKRKIVFHLLSNWIFRNQNSLFVNGKQPTSLSVTWSRSELRNWSFRGIHPFRCSPPEWLAGLAGLECCSFQ